MQIFVLREKTFLFYVNFLHVGSKHKIDFNYIEITKKVNSFFHLYMTNPYYSWSHL